MKKITLPKHMKPQAELFAKIQTELMGLKKGTSAYDKAMKDAFYNFCYEAYSHSMTPSGQLGQNPWSPPVQKRFIQKSVNKIKDRKGLSGSEKKRLQAQLEKVTTILSQLYFWSWGYNVKGKGRVRDRKSGRGSETNTVTKTSYSDFEFQSGMSQEEKIKVYRNIYRRIYIASLFTLAISSILAIDFGEEGADVINENLMPSLNSQILNDPKKLIKLLSSEDTKTEFVQRIMATHTAGTIDLVSTAPKKMKTVGKKKTRKKKTVTSKDQLSLFEESGLPTVKKPVIQKPEKGTLQYRKDKLFSLKRVSLSSIIELSRILHEEKKIDVLIKDIKKTKPRDNQYEIILSDKDARLTYGPLFMKDSWFDNYVKFDSPFVREFMAAGIASGLVDIGVDLLSEEARDFIEDFENNKLEIYESAYKGEDVTKYKSSVLGDFTSLYRRFIDKKIPNYIQKQIDSGKDLKTLMSHLVIDKTDFNFIFKDNDLEKLPNKMPLPFAHTIMFLQHLAVGKTKQLTKDYVWYYFTVFSSLANKEGKFRIIPSQKTFVDTVAEAEAIRKLKRKPTSKELQAAKTQLFLHYMNGEYGLKTYDDAYMALSRLPSYIQNILSKLSVHDTQRWYSTILPKHLNKVKIMPVKANPSFINKIVKENPNVKKYFDRIKRGR